MTNSSELTVLRVRHETKRRNLLVRRVTPLSPSMLRITVGGKELDGFVTAAFDDHIKIFFPGDVKRDFTPRRFDAAAEELDIDFALHGSGPACEWAGQAQVGDSVAIGGPRGSFIVPTTYDWHLLVGDETALPAIGRRLEELPLNARVFAVVEVNTAKDQIAIQSGCGDSREICWLHRTDSPARSLIDRIRTLQLPTGNGFVWAAGEASAMRSLHDYLVVERGHNKSHVRTSAYWRRGSVAVHEVIEV